MSIATIALFAGKLPWWFMAGIYSAVGLFLAAGALLVRAVVRWRIKSAQLR